MQKGLTQTKSIGCANTKWFRDSRLSYHGPSRESNPQDPSAATDSLPTAPSRSTPERREKGVYKVAQRAQRIEGGEKKEGSLGVLTKEKDPTC
ncbi:unnamed protein product [Caenorhabditis nigoni]